MAENAESANTPMRERPDLSAVVKPPPLRFGAPERPSLQTLPQLGRDVPCGVGMPPSLFELERARLPRPFGPVALGGVENAVSCQR
jgi:hypothetical protein